MIYFWKGQGQAGLNMSYLTWPGQNIWVIEPNIWVLGPNNGHKIKYLANIDEQFGSKANWQYKLYIFGKVKVRPDQICHIWRGRAQIFKSWGQIFESWAQILTEKANIWQNLTRNLEVKQIDNINYIFLERSRSGRIKYVIFDVAGPKYSSPEAK